MSIASARAPIVPGADAHDRQGCGRALSGRPELRREEARGAGCSAIRRSRVVARSSRSTSPTNGRALEADEPLREAYATLVNDLYDEEFDESLFELLTSARGLHQDHLASGHSPPTPIASSRSTSRS